MTLNQEKAISFLDGNALINAGAGSGKSTVLVARILKLITEYKVDSKEILGLTFTNEAAENMRKKLKGFIGKKKSDEVSLSTFHSFAYSFLKSRYANEYTNKKIMQSWWKLKTVFEIVDEEGLSINGGELSSFISYQKANMILSGMDVLIDDKVAYTEDESRFKLQSAFERYCDLTKNARVIDFDDMLLDFYYKLKDDESLQNELKNKYKYIMIDEFQDTNSVSLAIIQLISNDNVFAVGDFRQGIYGFINATIDNILDFKDNFNNVELIELSENFRSTDEIVKISNDIISSSPVESYKDFSSQIAARNIKGSPVNINIVSDEEVESRSILYKIEYELERNPNLKYSDFCILSRTNAQLGQFESFFAQNDVPVNVSSNRSFFDRREISDMIAYLTHIQDERDDMSIRKIMNSPNRFLPKSLAASLDEYAYKNGINLETAMTQMDTGKSMTRLIGIVSMFETWRNELHEKSAHAILKRVYNDLKYEEFMMKSTTSPSDISNKLDSIEILFDIASKFSNLKSFLGHISVVKNNNKKTKNSVNLMTVHASKGLEFNTVFVTGANEKSFPHDMNTDYEEERRLFYVATSRAIDNLHIYSPSVCYDKSDNVASKNLPSPFLVDICGQRVMDSFKSIAAGSTEISFTY